ncbi:MAG: glycosyl transferase family 2 [uncultured bacterium]|nr:MAG: glycosyl transferase family 2 [uncultured bacterium]
MIFTKKRGETNKKMLKKQDSNNSYLQVHNKGTSLYFSSASFWLPDLINTSAWIEHAPFAFWLISVINPNMFVELGTHQGYSYFAFCQAVQQLGFPTQCYAIDTWKGDEHSGLYGEEVFHSVNTYNNQKYASFSQLMRSTFDDALEYFVDKSIDILHIDGRHFYEDIKHDFEAWLPKLSDKAVVLFHDTNVKERHFGVFKLWEELYLLYPHFLFIHGHGLGVLGIGKSQSPEMRALFDAANNDEQVAYIRLIYSRLGADLNDRYKLGQTESNMSTVSKEIIVLKNQLEQLQGVLKNKEEEKKQTKIDLEIKDQEMQQLKNQLSLIEIVLKEKNITIEEREASIAHLYHVVTKMSLSKSWRWTLPLRKLKQFFSSSHSFDK